MISNSRAARLAFWFRKRNVGYLVRRAIKLLTRYGISSGKARKRTLAFVRLLAENGCAPTLATPGRVVEKHAAFMRQLRDAGVELAVHGFDHVDFRSLSAEASRAQFLRAVRAYETAGIPFRGFRCPYLSFGHDMSAGVPAQLFGYSSNEAVWWDVVSVDGKLDSPIFEHLRAFYAAKPASEAAVLPRRVGELVEIPVSLPDDLQLLDGLAAGDGGVRDAWVEMLVRSHHAAAIFVVLFHPESFYSCEGALRGLLERARALEPAVWIARLGDVSDWWDELAGFVARAGEAEVELTCSERATILVRGVEGADAPVPFDDRYNVLAGRALRFDASRRPFVGVSDDIPPATAPFLRACGYIVESGDRATSCAVTLDAPTIEQLGGEVGLLAHLEAIDAPLVRFWHWPDGSRSALAITGDLDALSLLDYAGRVFTL